MKKEPSAIPKNRDGTYDKETVKAQFMASEFFDWTRFAEAQGWNPGRSRAEFPVRSWQKEKRDALTVNQMDTLSSLFHERKFKWTHEVIKTLDDYPRMIDTGTDLAKWKMVQIGDMAKDYFDNFRGKPEAMYFTSANGKKHRRLHPFEKLSPVEIAALLRGLESLTQAKLKALMLDKWAVGKFDMPLDEPPSNEDGEIQSGPTFTIEGRGEVDNKTFENWMDTYLDKPTDRINDVKAEDITTPLENAAPLPDEEP